MPDGGINVPLILQRVCAFRMSFLDPNTRIFLKHARQPV